MVLENNCLEWPFYSMHFFFVQELKEKKEVEVEDKENGSGEAPANGTVS